MGRGQCRRLGTDGIGITVDLSAEDGDRNASRRNSTALANSNNPSVNSLQGMRNDPPSLMTPDLDSDPPGYLGSFTTNTTGGTGGRGEAHREGDAERATQRTRRSGDVYSPFHEETHSFSIPDVTSIPSGPRFSQRSGQQQNKISRSNASH